MEDIQKWHPLQILYFPISKKYILLTYIHKEQQSLSSNKFSYKNYKEQQKNSNKKIFLSETKEAKPWSCAPNIQDETQSASLETFKTAQIYVMIVQF